MRYRPLTVARKTEPDAIPSNEETDDYGLYLGDDWPKPAGSPAYESLATGAWEEVEITDAMLRSWERESAGKLTTKRLPNGDIELFGDHTMVMPGYEARNTIFRVELEPKWSDDRDFVAVGVRRVRGLSCEVMMEADGDVKLYAGPKFYMTHRQFDGRYRGTCELAIAAIGNQISGYVNGRLVLTTTKWAARSGPPAIDLSAGAVVKRVEAMVLTDKPTGVAEPAPLPKAPDSPDYDHLERGEWSRIEFTDDLLARWQALTPGNIRISRLDDGGVRILGPHTADLIFPGFEGRDMMLRARVRSRFRNGSSFIALHTRRHEGKSYAISFHPKYQLRSGYDLPRWHQVHNVDFATPLLDEFELTIASVGPWVRGYIDGREVSSLTNWQFDAGTIGLQTQGCFDLLSLELMPLDDPKVLSAIRTRFAKAREAVEVEPSPVAKEEMPLNPWPHAREKPEYAKLERGAWQAVEIDEDLRNSWEEENGFDHFTREHTDGSLEFIGDGRLHLPPQLRGKNVLLRAELTQYWGDTIEWIFLGARHQEDATYVGSHLHCSGKVTTGNFPRGRWALVEQEVFDEIYDGRIELVVAVIDESVVTYVNGKQVTSFATKIQSAGGLLLRHDGPFVLHKLEFMNLDEQGEKQ